MNKVRVLIIEDSRVVRHLLEHLVRNDPRLDLGGSAESAEEGLRLLHRLSPDVVSMDIRLPGMNGFQATQRIMAEKPTPVVVVSASVEAEDLQISMNALRAGALAVLEKPVGTSHQDYELLAEQLCNHLYIMSQVKVVRQCPGWSVDFSTEFAKPTSGLASSEAKPDLSPSPSLGPAPGPGPFRLLGVVASTGGPRALAHLLGSLPPDFPLPIVIVQHITASFFEGFVSWLGTVSTLPVSVARDFESPLPGHVYLPAADYHLQLVDSAKGRLSFRHDRGEPVCLQRPSGTVLFRSMAQTLGKSALGVLLTGMGEDGAAGLLELRRAGGYTLAEDESTTVVYGMPEVAVRLGAVCESLPLPKMTSRILELIRCNKETA